MALCCAAIFFAVWYDGYKLKQLEIYNPESVIKAALTGEFRSYWSGEIVFAGVNYDEKAKKHTCKIERFVK